MCCMLWMKLLESACEGCQCKWVSLIQIYGECYECNSCIPVLPVVQILTFLPLWSLWKKFRIFTFSICGQMQVFITSPAEVLHQHLACVSGDNLFGPHGLPNRLARWNYEAFLENKTCLISGRCATNHSSRTAIIAWSHSHTFQSCCLQVPESKFSWLDR
jgi:hypothetical protein